MAKFNRLNSLAVEQKLMVAEDFELSKQLAMSKPLVSGMLEFLSSKSNTKQGNEALQEKIVEIQQSLIKCIHQAEIFARAAYYD
jgi:hypothetical protein